MPNVHIEAAARADIRLLHHVQIVHIDDRSYRLRELDGLLKPPTAGAQPAKKSPSAEGMWDIQRLGRRLPMLSAI